MICKKCGTNLADTSKFCGYCGDKVEQSIELNNLNIELVNLEENKSDVVVENNNVQQEVNEVNQIDDSKNYDNEITQVIPPITDQISTSNFENLTQEVQPVEQQSNEKISKEAFIDQSSHDEDIESVQLNETKQNYIEPVQETKKNNTKWIFIILGIVLVTLVLVLLFIAFNKSSNSSISVLEKALNNFEEKSLNSGAIDVNILIESSTSDTMNLSASIKYAKNSDIYDLDIKLNKSLLYDEINLYSKVAQDKLTLYAKSSVIDMLGITSSSNDMWLYYIVDLTEMILEETQTSKKEINLSDIIDEQHFRYIDRVDNLNHYQFVIDNELLKKLDIEKIYNMTDVTTSIGKQYIIDMYMNESDEIVKLSIDLTGFVDETDISKVITTIEFINMNNTTVIIPQEALNSQIDLETYMSTYAIVGDDYTENNNMQENLDNIYYNKAN